MPRIDISGREATSAPAAGLRLAMTAIIAMIRPESSARVTKASVTGSAPAGETWYWQTTATGTSTANSTSAYIVNTSGTYYVRSRDNTTLAWSSGAGSITITITPNVATPVFAVGATSSRCMGAGTVTYTATASNTSGITYSLDAASNTGGNSINVSTGAVTYVAGWTGTSTITASAAGCSGPKTATHTVHYFNYRYTGVCGRCYVNPLPGCWYGYI